MKLRIITKLVDGNVRYFPQYRWMFMWQSFTNPMFHNIECYASLEDAKNYLNAFKRKLQSERAKQHNIKCVNNVLGPIVNNKIVYTDEA